LLESLYRFDVDERTHLRLIAEAAARHWRRRAAVMLVTARVTRPGRVEMMPLQVARDGGRDYGAIIGDVVEHIPEHEFLDCLSVNPVYGAGIELEREGALKSRISDRLAQRWRIPDVMGCYSSTHEGGLVGLISPLGEVSTTSRRERDHWQPIAAHLASAWRLRQRLSSGAIVGELADAAFLPDGRCVDHAATALTSGVRDRLRDLVRQREHERCAELASDRLWSELIDGRWTLIDHHESSGRRVVLAVRNAPAGASLCRLNRREIDALSHARRGASNKEIGLGMNLTASSVTRVLQSAARKLNAALADVLQLFSGDTVRCRSAMGDDSVLALSMAVAATWRTTLSAAERAVVAELLRGRSNREIAARRGRSVRTIVNQLASAFEKLGVHSRRELALRCGAGLSEPG
ncbi:MAG TPA: LuxR C-terminal-related transcriptional regulator, partial [Kofleriaceae bacterium]|nr:LuxR C-terminal-related transcriptional regulator [Kofleriaceae bacterium]